MFGEERDDRGIEIAMEGVAVEAGRVAANLRGCVGERVAARGEKREMVGVRQQMRL